MSEGESGSKLSPPTLTAIQVYKRRNWKFDIRTIRTDVRKPKMKGRYDDEQSGLPKISSPLLGKTFEQGIAF